MDNFKNEKDQKLWSAAYDAKFDEVKKALDEGADVNGVNYLEMTPLHAVLDNEVTDEAKQMEIVEYLIEKGADMEKLSELGETPMMLAIKNGRFRIVKLLNEKGVDLQRTFSSGMNYIYYAADNYDGNKEILDIIEYLIEQGVNPDEIILETNQTTLFRVADLGYKEVVEMLIKGGAKVNHKDEWGISALHYAARNGHLDVVKSLVDGGADINAREDYGFTPLHEAAENGRVEILKFLISKGADRSLGLQKGFDSYEAGDKAIDIARKAGQSEAVAFLEGLNG